MGLILAVQLENAIMDLISIAVLISALAAVAVIMEPWNLD